MDLNKNAILFSNNIETTKNDNFGDIALGLDCFGQERTIPDRSGSNKSNVRFHVPNPADDGCKLFIGLGPTPSAYCNDYFSGGMSRNKELSTTLHRELSSESDSILQLGLSGWTKEGASFLDSSVSTDCANNASQPSQVLVDKEFVIPVVDEGSTSAKKSGGYMPSLLLAPRMHGGKQPLKTRELLEFDTGCGDHQLQTSHENSSGTDISMCTGASSEQRSSNPRRCQFPGCTKGARGASGLCIGHGGGQRCQKPGCTKGAESRTAYCKAHGGGKRCQYLGCTKSAEGKTEYCIAHGGGRRCGYPGGCSKAARGRSGLCIRHGGGKRCKMDGCTRSAEGQAGLCISHGGGRRCQHLGCNKGAQGSTKFCKAHGGGKRCIFSGCTKGAEGSTPLCKGHGGGKRCMYDGGGICPKSVHGGTNFCVAHGGGKRCAVPGCTKSARGRTDCCVRHGGGKRCKVEGCGKSAQGSTDFCKAHGGGKRCNWGQGKCEKFARGKSGLCAAHSSMVQERETQKGGLIAPGLFRGLVSAVSSLDNNNSSSGVSVLSDTVDSMERPAKRHHLIPPQLLLPLSMKSSSSNSRSDGSVGRGVNLDFEIPEGRVHGGGLMSLLGGSLSHALGGFSSM